MGKNSHSTSKGKKVQKDTNTQSGEGKSTSLRETRKRQARSRSEIEPMSRIKESGLTLKKNKIRKCSQKAVEKVKLSTENNNAVPVEKQPLNIESQIRSAARSKERNCKQNSVNKIVCTTQSRQDRQIEDFNDGVFVTVHATEDDEFPDKQTTEVQSQNLGGQADDQSFDCQIEHSIVETGSDSEVIESEDEMNQTCMED